MSGGARRLPSRAVNARSPARRVNPTAGPVGASDRPIKRSLSIAGHRTSISLEPAFWESLQRAATDQGVSLAALVRQIDEARTAADDGDSGLSSCIRVYLLRRAEAAPVSPTAM